MIVMQFVKAREHPQHGDFSNNRKFINCHGGFTTRPGLLSRRNFFPETYLEATQVSKEHKEDFKSVGVGNP